ncbi:DEAD/DEAH box helicase [Sorangium sp. So ce295]|uniref:DEAD/DEAH box helicase n=1 Tax=Sorangium sp. So ce295 TaxID=3133295 RepID=UPI003F632A16
MTILPPSSSEHEPGAPVPAFGRLHEKIQRWIWDEQWKELRDLQELAVEPILSGERDVILSAATASGKTEAAFFPICTRILEREGTGVRALYVSPLKALINDQFRRLERLCERLDIPVHRWHGDVSSERKRRFLQHPGGILLITPESLEALFVVHGSQIARLFQPISYAVIDELHSFIGSERGRQLQSLLHRMEVAVKRRIPRVALSATLGDMKIAAEFLRPWHADEVQVITSAAGGGELRLIVRGFLTRRPEDTPEDEVTEDVHAIADQLFRTLRGSDNLIFANRRGEVELYADLLARKSERERVPNEFFAHHGSLAKELREDVEARLKKEIPGPVNVVCTSTLEMGIDIGSVRSVAQLGAPFSVASLRQRLGRSGRREGEPAILRAYVREEEVTDTTAPPQQIRAQLVQTIAIVSLLLEKWCEPPVRGKLHLSTLVQQLLSTIAQHGGVKPLDAYRVLCETGPFADISRAMFASLLRCLGYAEVVTQSSDGTLLLDRTGERVVNHYSFFTAFQTPEEFRLVNEGRTLGTLPVKNPLVEGAYLIFGGRRWRILSVDLEHKVADLAAAAGGRVPSFGDGAGFVHDRVRERMRELYESFEMPSFVDPRASELLVEGRTNFDRLGLRERRVIAWGRDAVLFPWAGDRVMNTTAVMMAKRGFEVAGLGVALLISRATPERILATLSDIVDEGPGDSVALARTVRNKAVEKYDEYLSEELLSATYASGMLDVQGMHRCLEASRRSMI